MAEPRKEPPEEVLAGLRGQIREWRERRKLPGPMPEEIWNAAAALAREFGVCPMAKALSLDYPALRKRTEMKPPQAGLVKPTFVLLSATLAPEPVLVGTTIEISSRDGSRMRIHLEAGSGPARVPAQTSRAELLRVVRLGSGSRGCLRGIVSRR